MTHTSEPCRLYLLVPEDADPSFADSFAATLQAGDVASVLLPAKLQDRELAARLKDIALARNVAVLVDGNVERVRALEADGVHIAAGEGLCEQARAALGENAIVGAYAGLSRHQGLVAGEAGADYVAFGGKAAPDEDDLTELIAWWAEIIEVPCIAWDVGSVEEARSLAEAGADFVAVGAPVWKSPQPQDVVRAFDAALAQARRNAA